MAQYCGTKIAATKEEADQKLYANNRVGMAREHSPRHLGAFLRCRRLRPCGQLGGL